MNNYFTSFCLPTHLEINRIRATGVLNKNNLCKCTIIADKQLQKEETQPVTLTVVVSNNSSAIYIATSESCEPKRFVRYWNKLEKKNYSRKTKKSVLLLQLEHGFFQQNGPERGQVLVPK